MKGGCQMVGKDGLELRKKALEILEKSTKMLEVALTLMKQGNRAEADRVRDDARRQRTISTLLMAEANQLETAPPPSHYFAHGAGARTHQIHHQR